MKCAHACKSTRFQWVEGAVRTGEMRGWGRVWGRWEKTGGGGGIVRHLLVTATLGNCTMHLILHQNDCTRVFVPAVQRGEWMCWKAAHFFWNGDDHCWPIVFMYHNTSSEGFELFIDADIDNIIANKRWDKPRDSRSDVLHMSVGVFKLNNMEHNRIIADYVGTQTPSSLSSGFIRRQDFQI